MKKLANIIFTLFTLMSWFTLKSQQPINPDEFVQKRLAMVEHQIIKRGITNPRVIEAMKTTPRHKFVLPQHLNEAYHDHPLDIGEGQTISQPYIVAFMTQALAPDSTMRVLEIGTGSGYQAAVLSAVCDSVFTVEINALLGQRADKILQELHCNNVQVKIGDGYEGWAEKAPFDAVLVTCAPTRVPEALLNQLAEGGKMIIPVGASYNQELLLFVKKNNELSQKAVLPVRFVPMIDEKGRQY